MYFFVNKSLYFHFFLFLQKMAYSTQIKNQRIFFLKADVYSKDVLIYQEIWYNFLIFCTKENVLYKDENVTLASYYIN